MNRYLFSLFMFVALSATAQDFKPFKVNVSIGFAKPLGAGASGGVLFAIEPKYGLSDHFDVGLRLESALVARSIVSNSTGYSGDVNAYASYLITGNYFFKTTGVRPFLGVGAGLFSSATSGNVTVVNGQTSQQVSLPGETKFGGMIRGGIKTGHFVAGVEYNAVAGTTSTTTNISIEGHNTYLGIKVGFDIGGGRRK